MSLHTSRRGLVLPIAGEPDQRVEPAPASPAVALLGADYPGLRPVLAVQPGEEVLRGAVLFHDRRTPAVRFTSPARGRVTDIHRGDRRALVSVVVAVDDAGAEAGAQVRLEGFTGRPPSALDAAEVRALLLESGLWTALRTRPFGRVPDPATSPHALFVTATDSRPLAANVERVTQGREEALAAGLTALAKLTDGPTFLCVAAGSPIQAPPQTRVQREEFAGPHPSGSVGWHIHRLAPASLDRVAWHLHYQDAIAIGRLFLEGIIDTRRVVALGGPGVARPRLLETRVGASLGALTTGELVAGRQRLISGSVLDGRRIAGPADAFLGRYHLQVSALPEGDRRELFGWIAPGADKHSVTGSVLGAFLRSRRLALTTTTNGSPRAMVPIGTYERVMPFDILPTLLLRALITGDDARAVQLGALELDEEDIALCTYVCPGKYEYGPLLRGALARIEKEA